MQNRPRTHSEATLGIKARDMKFQCGTQEAKWTHRIFYILTIHRLYVQMKCEDTRSMINYQTTPSARTISPIENFIVINLTRREKRHDLLILSLSIVKIFLLAGDFTRFCHGSTHSSQLNRAKYVDDILQHLR